MHRRHGAARRLLVACGGDVEGARRAADLSDVLMPGSGALATLQHLGMTTANELAPEPALSYGQVTVALLRDIAAFATQAADEIADGTERARAAELAVTYQTLTQQVSGETAVRLLRDSQRFSKETLGRLSKLSFDSPVGLDEHTTSRRAN